MIIIHQNNKYVNIVNLTKLLYIEIVYKISPNNDILNTLLFNNFCMYLENNNEDMFCLHRYIAKFNDLDSSTVGNIDKNFVMINNNNIFEMISKITSHIKIFSENNIDMILFGIDYNDIFSFILNSDINDIEIRQQLLQCNNDNIDEYIIKYICDYIKLSLINALIEK